MEEIFESIKGYEGMYEISNFGRVKSLQKTTKFGLRFKTYPEKILLPQNNNNGYLKVILGGKNKYIHRLVAEAFIPNPENKPQVNHKDGNKKNNHVDNLEWATSKEDSDHKHSMGLVDYSKLSRKGITNGNSKLTNEDVKRIREVYLARKYSRRKLAKEYSVSVNTIDKILDRTLWKHL